MNYEAVDLAPFDAAASGKTLRLRVRLDTEQRRAIARLLLNGDANGYAAALAFILGVKMNDVDAALNDVSNDAKKALFAWRRDNGLTRRPGYFDVLDSFDFNDYRRSEAVLNG